MYCKTNRDHTANPDNSTHNMEKNNQIAVMRKRFDQKFFH
jgi:hypothetical protein